MLAVPADRLPTALADLDPGNRALLDLSLRRGVSDAEIGELLSKRPDEVARGRDAVLELLADALDVAGHDRRDRVRQAVAALPDEAWRGRAPSAPPPRPSPPEAVARPEPPPPEREPPPPEEPEERDEEIDERPTRRQPAVYIAPGEGRRPRRAGMLVAIGLLVVVVALALLLFGGGGDDDEPAPNGDRNGAEPAPDGGGAQDEREVPLRAVGGGDGGGRVSVSPAGEIVISVRDLPPAEGSYQAWLYNSVVDATAVGTLEGPNGRLSVRLPAEAGDYRFIDVSREPADGNANHSGASVLRAPLGELLSE